MICGAVEGLFVKLWSDAEYLRAALDKGRLEKYYTAMGDENPVPNSTLQTSWYSSKG